MQIEELYHDWMVWFWCGLGVKGTNEPIPTECPKHGPDCRRPDTTQERADAD